MQSQSQLPDIPPEIIADILSCLPVKSLVRFKFVCKSWDALISDKKFSLSDNRRERERTLIFNRIGFWNPPSSKVNYSINHDLVVEQFVPTPSPTPSDRPDVKILGSCKGLVLFFCDQSIYVWNPSTRFFKQVYNISNLEIQDSCSICASGFCYDDFSDDYKVILALRRAESFREQEIVYSSFKSKNNWTEITNCTFIIFGSYTATAPLVNGNLHWIGSDKKKHQSCRDLLVYFEAKSNELKVLPLPEPRNIEENWISGLGVVNGCLCMIRPDSDQGEILVMKEYGVKNSWTVMYKLPSRFRLTKGVLEPILFTKNEDLLFAHDGGCHVWAFYHTKNVTLRIVQLPKEPQSLSIQLSDMYGCTYVESLAAVE